MRSVARVVVAAALLLAACGGAQASRSVELTGDDALAYSDTAVTAAAGAVEIELTSAGTAEHTVVIEQLGDREVVRAAGGQTATGTVELEPGSYTFYCDVAGHRAAGMEGTLTVVG